jgi:hypothetical protein
MRTTLTLDDDVAAKLNQRCRESGESFKAVVNQMLRDGLNVRQQLAPDEPFHIRARPLGLLPGVDLDNISEVIEQLDGPAHK